MTRNEENEAWLAMAVTLPTGYIGESCYYDKRDNQFFILTNLDYILNDDQLRPCFLTNYTEEETAMLIDKLQRLEAEGDELVLIPRISIEERVEIQMAYLAYLEGMKYFDLMVDTVAEQDHTAIFALDQLLKQHDELNILCDHWFDFKLAHIQGTINHFITAHALDLSTVKLWHIEKSRAMTKIKQPDSLQAVASKQESVKKAWWRIWQ